MGQSNYSAAKAGLIADTVTWGKELATVFESEPLPRLRRYPILSMRPEVLENMLKVVPLRRTGTTDASSVRFIIECDYFTGRCIDIDGGMRFRARPSENHLAKNR